MIIDKEQLVTLLKERTGLERKQVERQLSQLIYRIHQAAEEGKDYEIEGFGTFSMTDDGLQFIPADKFETEINNKYAGMKPIELIGAFKEPDEDEEVPEIDIEESPADVNRNAKWALDTEAMGGDASEEEDEEQEAYEYQESPVGGVTDKSKDESPKETVSEGLARATATIDEKVDEESDGLLGTILVAAVVVLAVGVGGWLAYDLGLANQAVSLWSTASESSSSEPITRNANNEGAALASEYQEADNSSEPEQQTQVPNGDEAEQPAEPEEQYGLFGEFNDGISNGYTIVVHSLRSRRTAEQNRRQLQESGYRALISRAVIQGVTYHRVGIGQFETVDDAQEALSDIPERYQNNNFIKRIQ